MNARPLGNVLAAKAEIEEAFRGEKETRALGLIPVPKLIYART
jgi:hypothetical protein